MKKIKVKFIIFVGLFGVAASLKCYGAEAETKNNKVDSFCMTKFHGPALKESGAECKQIDCDALSESRLKMLKAPPDSKPTSCFIHHLQNFDGSFTRIHACGPDKHDVIPYSLLLESFDRASGMDNGFLRLRLQEDCRVLEIERENAGKTRVCKGGGAGKCAPAYMEPGADFANIDNVVLSGGSVCPGRGVCETQIVAGASRCVCTPAFKACKMVVSADADEERKCEPRVLKRSEITVHDSVCDFVEEIKCQKGNESGICPCAAPKKFGIDKTKLTATCRFVPKLKPTVLVQGMKEVCRKKERETTGTWHPAGGDAQINAMCYCNKGDKPCNGSHRLQVSTISLPLEISFVWLLFIRIRKE